MRNRRNGIRTFGRCFYTRIREKSRLWSVCFGAALAAFTLFVLLDTFVIVRRYSAAETPESAAQRAEASAEPIVTVTAYRFRDSDVHVADILLSSPDQLRTALAQNAYGRNITALTSAMAGEQSALVAINGDYYGSRNAGYVIRNGVLYRERSAGDSQMDLVINSDGVFSLVLEGEYTARELLDGGAAQVFSFGPGLLENGEIIVDERDEVGQAMVSNPRTAIAMIEPLHYLFVVSDGRTDDSAGLSLYELAEFLQQIGASVAYNLDGGGSSTMVYEGEIVNYPTTRGRFSEREVSDIVYVQ